MSERARRGCVMKKCSQCGSTKGYVGRLPTEEGFDLFCKPCGVKMIERCLEAYPEDFVRHPDGTWSCVDDIAKH